MPKQGASILRNVGVMKSATRRLVRPDASAPGEGHSGLVKRLFPLCSSVASGRQTQSRSTKGLEATGSVHGVHAPVEG